MEKIKVAIIDTNETIESYKKELEVFDTVQNNAQNIANLAGGKLDKITQPSDNVRVYAISTKGEQTTVGMSVFPEQAMLVRYGLNGRLKVTYPDEAYPGENFEGKDYDAIPKKYVDDSINGISLDYEIDENYKLTLRLKKGKETINEVEINLPLESSIVEMKETVDEGGQPVLRLTLANGNVTTVALDDVFKLVNTNVEDLKAGLSGKVENTTYNAKIADLEAGLSGKVENASYSNDKDAVQEELAQKVDIADFEKVKQELNTTDIRLTNIEARFSDDAVIDSTVAYEKHVPANALPYAEVQKVGGMTYRISPPFSILLDNEMGLINADGSITDSNLYGENEHVEISMDSEGLSGKYFTLAEECPYISDVYITLIFVENDYVTSHVNTYSLNSWLPEFDYDKYSMIDGKLHYRVPANTDTFTFKPILTDTDDLTPKLLDTKVTALVSEGANLLIPGYVDGTKTVNGITFTDNGNGTLTINGTATEAARYILKTTFNFVNGVTYTASVNIPDVKIEFTYTTVDGVTRYPNSVTKTEGDNVQKLFLNILPGQTFDNVIVKPMLNRGTTAAPYKPYRADAVDIFAIPEAIRVLDGYGQSNPDNTNEYNYIDFVKKVFVAYGQVINNEWIAYDAPIETPISAYLTDDNFIEVEAGGGIKAVNEYKYGAPSTIEYQTEVVE